MIHGIRGQGLEAGGYKLRTRLWFEE